MRKLNSPYELLTVKSLPRLEQVELLNSLSELRLDPLTVNQLEAKFHDVAPLSSGISRLDILQYWALAIVLSDIAGIQWSERRFALAADWKDLSQQLNRDYRVVTLLSSHADWAISIIDSCLRRPSN